MAIVLSFLVTKLIAMAISSDCPSLESEFMLSKNGDEGVVVDQVRGEERLMVQISE